MKRYWIKNSEYSLKVVYSSYLYNYQNSSKRLKINNKRIIKDMKYLFDFSLKIQAFELMFLHFPFSFQSSFSFLWDSNLPSWSYFPPLYRTMSSVKKAAMNVVKLKKHFSNFSWLLFSVYIFNQLKFEEAIFRNSTENWYAFHSNISSSFWLSLFS